MKKRILALLLVTALLLSAVPVFAEETPSFAVETVTAKAGETVDVTISTENNPGIASIKISVTYDEKLVLNSVTYNSAIGGMSMQPQSLTSPVTLNWFNGLADTEGDWAFATLSFTVSDTASTGTYPITVSYDANDVYNIAEENVAFVIKNGGITIACTHANKTEVPAKSPDCVNTGNHKYYTCACGKFFKADGTTETTIEAETIASLGHDWGDADCSVPSTCKREGCGATSGGALGHDWSEKIEDEAHLERRAPNCTLPNRYWYDCSRCDAISTTEYFLGDTYGQHAFTETIPDDSQRVPGSGADCQSVIQYYYGCGFCDEMNTEIWDSTTYGEHKMETSWTSKDGKHYHKCSVSGCDHIEDEQACSGGTASCTAQAVCSVCNTPYGELAQHDYKSEWNQGDASGHWHDCKNCTAHDNAVMHTPNVEAATEETAKYCTVCGYVIQAQLDHTHRTTKVDGYAATCTEDGQKTYYTCPCGKWFEDSTANIEITDKSSVVMAALQHDLSDATCTAPKTCKRDGCTYTEGTALGHDWTEKTEDAEHLKSAAADCTECNVYWYGCSRCDLISTTDYFTGTTVGAHAFTEKIEDTAYLASAGDCQTVKTYYYACELCDATGTATWNSTAYGGHKMAADWISENGKHYHACTVEGCDHIEDEALCSGGTATCTEKATCSVCGNPHGELAEHDYNTEWSKGDASGHWHDCKNCTNHDAAVAHTPGAEATEDTAQTCTVCGYVIKAALGHTHAVTKVEGKAATCTEAGQKAYYTCSCGKWFEDSTANIEITDKDSLVIAALGHMESDWQSDKDNHWKVCNAEGCEAEIANSKAAHTDNGASGLCDTCSHKVAVADPSLPKTGDESFVMMWALLLALSAAAIVVCIRIIKFRMYTAG